ncbi:dimethylaniline monooxygenase, putative [Cordyceps militaris CM01]|uniref:Dimethylaniline monooxygenase, putative n=1 Tax=Cordyceps militaris (strain CM01) TaxID=983644 RepID=G3JDD0_CORMM|nr:dimethylaniline monooxygenase, putative [Cordyceps militaris CM01]EGX92605.1 dimethylaniline monooxygenase, putative [Cordyceps militaris CM01]
MNSYQAKVKSVAIIGAGPSGMPIHKNKLSCIAARLIFPHTGAVAAAALKAENYFDHIRVFERRETAGGTWIHDTDPGPVAPIEPGKLPSEIDLHLPIPPSLPTTTSPDKTNRWASTPVYDSLSTNVPNIVMTFSDALLPYGPFAPHYVARQYVENYFSLHQTDTLLQTNTAVEDLTRSPATKHNGQGEWKLTLRKYDASRQVDEWWEEFFDAVVLANGHYAVPYVPMVNGLEPYMEKYPGRVSHSKRYRNPKFYAGQRVIVVGNSVSGRELSEELVGVAKGAVYLSRRSPAIWEGDEPRPGIVWKPVISEYRQDGAILFSDGTTLADIDAIIYCTGYKPSFPFWNHEANGGPLFDYRANRLIGSYQHVFFREFPTLGVVGFPKTLTFRSFEYQAIALARLWSGRNARSLPSPQEQQRWEADRAERTQAQHKSFHDVPWGAETNDHLRELFNFAGLSTLAGDGLLPPPLTREMVWTYENVLKWKMPKGKGPSGGNDGLEEDTVMEVHRDAPEVESTSGPQEARGEVGKDWVVVDKTEGRLKTAG